jgi:hypothetical protein
MNHCSLPHRSATIVTGYCMVFSVKKFRGRLGLMSVIEVRIHTAS